MTGRRPQTILPYHGIAISKIVCDFKDKTYKAVREPASHRQRRRSVSVGAHRPMDTCTESLSARRHKGAGAAAIVAGGGARRPPRPPSGGTTLTAEPLLLYSHQRKGEIVGEYGQVGSPSRHTVAQWRRRRSGARAAREAAGGERSVARSVARAVEIARDCTRVGAGRRPSRAALARCGCAPCAVVGPKLNP